MPQHFDLTDLIEVSLDARLAGVHTALPGIITEYDATLQRASVQPSVWTSYEDETGEVIPERLPIVQAVPLLFPGAGGFRVTFPVQVGDSVLLVFCSGSLDRWLTNGGDQDPGDYRRHHLSDAIAIPGLRDFGHALTNAPTDRMSLGADNGATIEINSSEVRLGGNTASDAVVKGTTYRGAEDTLFTALRTLATSLATLCSALATSAPTLGSPVQQGATSTAAGAAATLATALATAVTTFSGASSTYLSTITKTK